jgi:hypothetical protein
MRMDSQDTLLRWNCGYITPNTISGPLPMLSCRFSPPQIAAFIQHRPLRRAAIFCVTSSPQSQAEKPWMALRAAVEVTVEVEAAEV